MVENEASVLTNGHCCIFHHWGFRRAVQLNDHTFKRSCKENSQGPPTDHWEEALEIPF